MRGHGAGILLLAVVTAPAAAEQQGRADVAVQGFYLGASSQPLLNLSGLNLNFHQFFPRHGMLRGNLEGYGRGGSFRRGDNYLEFIGLPFRGMRWSLTGGDFRVPMNLVDFPFQNIFYPEIGVRGVRLEASGRNHRYRFFHGQQTLMDGPRVNLRGSVPQRATGITIERRLHERLQLGVNLMRLTNGDIEDSSNHFLFPKQFQFPAVDRLSLVTLYTPTDHWSFYAEGAASRASRDGGPAAPLSTLAGFAYVTPRLTARGNYSQLGAAYLPLAGFFLGDRRGPFGEARVRPLRKVELFSSAGKFENNLERRSGVPMMESESVSAGGTFALPMRFNFTGQLSTVRFQSVQPGEGERQTRYRQRTAALGRPIGRHTLRLTGTALDADSAGLRQRHQSAELEDSFGWNRWMIGGALRWQNTSVGGVVRNSRRGALPHGWNLQAEAFRNVLLTSLNPENIFLLETRGLAPVMLLSSLNQWSLYLRLARQFDWGGPMPPLDTDSFGGQHLPLAGSLEGLVRERGEAGWQPVPGVAVSLNGQRKTYTDEYGRYRFPEVPEGRQFVMLSAEELPAEFDAGSAPAVAALVQPGKLTRLDFEVVRLLELEGRVEAPAGFPLENIVISLYPSSTMTTTEADGRFTFYNLRETDYRIRILAGSLPAGLRLSGGDSMEVSPRHGRPRSSVIFRLEALEPEFRPVEERILPQIGETPEVVPAAPRAEETQIAVAEPSPASAPARRFVVQAGAFRNRQNAERLMELLLRAGLAARLVQQGSWLVWAGQEHHRARLEPLRRQVATLAGSALVVEDLTVQDTARGKAE